MPFRDFAMMVFICLIWASNTIVAKLAISDLSVPPVAFGAARCLVIAALTWPWLRPIPKHWMQLALAGFLIGGGSFALFFMGLKHTNASSAGVVILLGIPITALLSIVFLQERISLRRALGICVTFIGAFLVMWEPGSFTLASGLLLVGLSALLTSAGAVMLKRIHKTDPMQIQAWAGAVAVLPLAVVSGFTESNQIGAMVSAGWPFLGCLFYSAVIVSIVAHTAYYWQVQRHDANLVAPLTLITPVATVFFAFEFLGEPIHTQVVMGCVTALIGVTIIVTGMKKKTAGLSDVATASVESTSKRAI